MVLLVDGFVDWLIFTRFKVDYLERKNFVELAGGVNTNTRRDLNGDAIQALPKRTPSWLSLWVCSFATELLLGLLLGQRTLLLISP